MLEKMDQNNFKNVNDDLTFFFEEINGLKKEYKDKESRVFFESLKNKFGDSLKNILNIVKNRVESETDCFEDISDTKEYKELKAYCTNLIFFLMQKKKECKALSRKLNTLFQFLCTHLECKDN
jgi:hypothetical protein